MDVPSSSLVEYNRIKLNAGKIKKMGPRKRYVSEGADLKTIQEIFEY
jgi:hypothetical protein